MIEADVTDNKVCLKNVKLWISRVILPRKCSLIQLFEILYFYDFSRLARTKIIPSFSLLSYKGTQFCIVLSEIAQRVFA